MYGLVGRPMTVGENGDWQVVYIYLEPVGASYLWRWSTENMKSCDYIPIMWLCLYTCVMSIMWSCCLSCDWVVLYYWIYKNWCVHSLVDFTMQTVHAICSVQCCVHTAPSIDPECPYVSWADEYPQLTWHTNPLTTTAPQNKARTRRPKHIGYWLAV